MSSRYDVTRVDVTPRNRTEAVEALALARAADPGRAGRYRIEFTPGGWIIVRRDPTR